MSCVAICVLLTTWLWLGLSVLQGVESHTHVHLPLKENCPHGFHRLGDGCYFYAYFRLNWFRAMEFCHSFGDGVSLAAIETWEENEEIKDWLEDNGDPSTGVWVSGSDNGHPGVWSWFSTGQLVQHGDWGVGQPRGGDHHCLYLVGGGVGRAGYQWADFHCDFQMTFICEHHGRTAAIEEYSHRDIENDIDYMEVNHIEEISDQKSKEDDISKVIAQNESSMVIQSKEVPENEVETKFDETTTWSIFQFIKNMIKLPFLILSNQ